MKVRYWIAIILGIILTPIGYKVATMQRGYSAVGGEFFILPLLLVINLAIDQVQEAIDEVNAVFKEREEKRWRQKEKAQSTTRC